MYTVLNAVKNHLIAGKTAGAFTAKTIKLYTGELQDVKKLSDQHPAVYVMPMNGKLISDIPDAQVDLIVITDSKIFNRQDNAEANLQLSEGLLDFIKENSSIESIGWTVNLEEVPLEVLAIDNKFTIVKITLPLSNLL